MLLLHKYILGSDHLFLNGRAVAAPTLVVPEEVLNALIVGLHYKLAIYAHRDEKGMRPSLMLLSCLPGPWVWASSGNVPCCFSEQRGKEWLSPRCVHRPAELSHCGSATAYYRY